MQRLIIFNGDIVAGINVLMVNTLKIKIKNKTAKPPMCSKKMRLQTV